MHVFASCVLVCPKKEYGHSSQTDLVRESGLRLMAAHQRNGYQLADNGQKPTKQQDLL
jgi:hypothetical protein